MPADLAAPPAGSRPELYSRDILRLAAGLPHGDSLANPDGSASLRAPLCGSEMRAEIALSGDGAIAAIAFVARACALGQASAALLRTLAPGRSIDEIAGVRAALAAALAGEGDFAAVWPEYGVFASARAHPARHAAILLPFDALIAAAKAARG